MKKIIIGAIIIIVVLIISSLAIVQVASDKGVIPPFTGEEPVNPDSGNGAGDSTVTYEIRFDTPNTATFNVPDSNNFWAIPITGTVYGTEISKVKYIKCSWHDDIAWARTIGSVPPVDGEILVTNIYDNNNIRWKTDMLIYQLGSGEHLLKAYALDSVYNVLAEASVIIVIPSNWKYGYDSRDSQDTGTFEQGSYYYQFCMPYKQTSSVEMWTSDTHWLMGNVIKIEGKIHVTVTSNDPYNIWCNIWNSVTSSWTTVKKDITVQGVGWFDVSITCNAWGSWISFAGSTAYKVDGFVGHIYVKPGTYFYNQNALEFLNPFKDKLINPPHP